MTLTETVKSFLKKPIIYLSTAALLATTVPSCYTQPVTRYDKPITRTEVYQEEDNNKTFIGQPELLEHNDSRDLDFIIKSYDGQEGKLFKVNVHEEGDYSNKDNLQLVEQWIREASQDPNIEIKVQGFYNPEYSRGDYEEGTLDPYVVIKLTQNDSLGTFEEVVWTDKKDSPIYTDTQANIVLDYVYYPGHRIGLAHYPVGFYMSWYPSWDIDGDGVPNEWDRWPTVYGPITDHNHNGIPDWHDPFYPFDDNSYWGYWQHHPHHPHHHHPNFIIVWQNYYGHEFHNQKDYRERNREQIFIRNNVGGRNIKGRDNRNDNERFNDILREQTKIRDKQNKITRDPNIERDSKSREIIKDRNPVIKNTDRDRTIDDKVMDRDKNIDKTRDRNSIYDKQDDKNRDVYKKNEDKNRDVYKKTEDTKRDEYKKSEDNNRQQQIDRNKNPTIKRDDTKKQDNTRNNTYERQKETRTNTTPPRQNVNPPPKTNTNTDRQRTETRTNTNNTRTNTNNNTQKTRDRK